MTEQFASDRTNYINKGLYQRNIPSQPLEPYFSVPSQSTKFTRFPVADQPLRANVPLQSYGVYHPSSTFYQANRNAPWSGYVNNVNDESKLRNQYYALQKDTLGTYIPNDSSQLYNVQWSNKQTYSKEENRFFNSNLFTPQQFSSFNPNPFNDEVGYNLFNNSTRVQNKNIKM